MFGGRADACAASRACRRDAQTSARCASGGGRGHPATIANIQVWVTTNHVAPCPARHVGVMLLGFIDGSDCWIPLITDGGEPEASTLACASSACSVADGGLDDRRGVDSAVSVTATIAHGLHRRSVGFVRQSVQATFIFVTGITQSVFEVRLLSSRADPRLSRPPSRETRQKRLVALAGVGRAAHRRVRLESWRQSRWSYPSAGRPRRRC